MVGISVRGLRADEETAWLDHCVEVFEGRASHAYFFSHLHDDPLALSDWNNIIVAVDDNVNLILASVRVVPREQFIAGSTITMSGIAEVSTKEMYRRHGLASQLLEAAANGAMIHSMLSLLHTNADRLGAFYERHNWEAVLHQDVFVPIIDDLPADPDLQVNTLVLRDHVDALLELYHAFSSIFDGPVVRNRAYFCQWVHARHARENIFVSGAWRDGRLVGYVFGKLQKGARDDSRSSIVLDVEELVVQVKNNTPLFIGQHLIQHVYHQTIQEITICNMRNTIHTTPIARVPLPVATFLSLDTKGEVVTDSGWMYRNLNCSSGLWHHLKTSEKTVFWRTDNF
jgi:hypothetical protein